MKFRIKQKQLLNGFLKDNTYVSPIVIYGPHSTGKTALITKIIANTYNKVYIDCHLVNSRKEIFNEILNQLFGFNVFNLQRFAKCVIHYIDQFLKFLMDSLKILEKTCFIIFDNYTALKELGNVLLPGFVRLNDSLRCNGKEIRCCLILIDQSIPSNLRHLIRTKELNTFYLRFPQYKKRELLSILSGKKLFYKNFPKKNWKNIIRWMINLFNHSRTISYFFYILTKLDLELQRYFYSQEKITNHFNVIRTKLKFLFKHFFKQKHIFISEGLKIRKFMKKKNTLKELSLSHVCKFLLVAGFIISRNDIKNFYYSLKDVKRPKTLKKNKKARNFFLQDLLITFDLLTQKQNQMFKPLDVLSQIALLCRLDFFSQIKEDLNHLRLKCFVKFQDALDLENELGLCIVQFL